MLFVELKSLLFAAIVAHVAGDDTEAVTLLEECVPRQLELGHINLIAQELCPRPELASLILRRHKSNGLGPATRGSTEPPLAIPAKSAPTLAELCRLTGADMDRPRSLWYAVRRETRGDGPAKTSRPAPPTATRRPSALDTLTPRERQVLRLMAEDRSNEEIAADLFLSIPTVKTHVNHILRKLGQKKRMGAVLEYQRLSDPASQATRPARYDASPPAGMTGNPPWV